MDNKKINACLVCGEELEFFETARELECVFCHRKFMANASCKEGHYVCDECHSKQAIESVEKIALSTTSINPVEIAWEMMENPYVHMHGNETHIIVGAALLAAYHNAGGDIDIGTAFEEMKSRGSQVPGGACGFWGACGAAVSTGMFISIITGSTPVAFEAWGRSNIMTSKGLAEIGRIGGPRCCKRNAFVAIKEAIAYCEEVTGIKMDSSLFICDFSHMNKECIGRRCPFNKVHWK